MKMGKERIYIVAEIGGNFSDLGTAKMLLEDAKWSGVDAVKLQTYQADTVASNQAIFDMENISGVSQKDYFRQYELTEEIHREIFDYAAELGLDIFSTPSHITDVELLDNIGVIAYKIGADDLTNIPFLKEIARRKKPILLSTGMGTMQEIHDAVDAMLAEGNSEIAILHVVSLYPTHEQDANLEAIRTLMHEFPQFTVGYSDHTMTIDACLFAGIMGARIIEKHFTYDKKAEGPDHIHSATKEEMKTLVDKLRLFERMRGDGIKRPIGDEIKNRRNNRKSIVYKKSMKAGERIKKESLDVKRPGTGILPIDIRLLEGKCLVKDVYADDLVSWTDFDS